MITSYPAELSARGAKREARQATRPSDDYDDDYDDVESMMMKR